MPAWLPHGTPPHTPRTQHLHTYTLDTAPAHTPDTAPFIQQLEAHSYPSTHFPTLRGDSTQPCHCCCRSAAAHLCLRAHHRTRSAGTGNSTKDGVSALTPGSLALRQRSPPQRPTPRASPGFGDSTEAAEVPVGGAAETALSLSGVEAERQNQDLEQDQDQEQECTSARTSSHTSARTSVRTSAHTSARISACTLPRQSRDMDFVRGLLPDPERNPRSIFETRSNVAQVSIKLRLTR